MIKLYPCFNSWVNEGTIWVFGDTHFEDDDCKLMDPNWVTPEEQVKLINRFVGKKDVFVLLGDVGNPEWISKLKTYKRVLVTGNHDKGAALYDKYFWQIYDGPVFLNDKLLLSHEPVVKDEPMYVNVHGHCHGGTDLDKDRYINVCSNTVGFMPMNLTKAIKDGLLKSATNYHRLTIDAAANGGNHIDKSIQKIN